MRIAYAGLSAPLFYDYGHSADQGPADTQSSPNPILDSPFGALLLYDEIWFLTRSLCPQNMRDVSYIRFMDEEGMLPDLSEIDVRELEDLMRDTPGVEERYARAGALFDNYGLILETMGINWGPAPDNHTHTLHIQGLETSANSPSPHSILTDLAVLQTLGRTDVEIIANSYAQSWIEEIHPELRAAPLTQVLVIDDIPNALTPEGPYDPAIEEIRRDPFLKDFREWVSKTAATDSREIAEIKHDVETVLRTTTREMIDDRFGHNRVFFSIGKTLTGTMADLIAPGSSTIASLASDVRAARQAKKKRWQAFLLRLPFK